MSFEDPPRRLKSRIALQCDTWKDTFHLVDRGVPALGSDFYKVVDEMIVLWPDIRAIVIDTMTFVMPPKKPNVTDYDHYYGLLTPLQRWAQQHHIAVICITHKRKGKVNEGENPFDGILGSVGIQGCADCLMMLSKNHAKANDEDNDDLADGFLEVCGRDVEQAKFQLDKDPSDLKWVLRDKVSTHTVAGTKVPIALLVLDALSKANKPLTPKEITSSLGGSVKSTSVRVVCRRLSKDGKVFSSDGKYSQDPIGDVQDGVEGDNW